MNGLTEVTLSFEEGKMVIRDLAGVYQKLREACNQQLKQNGTIELQLQSRTQVFESICNKILKAANHLN